MPQVSQVGDRLLDLRQLATRDFDAAVIDDPMGDHFEIPFDPRMEAEPIFHSLRTASIAACEEANARS